MKPIPSKKFRLPVHLKKGDALDKFRAYYLEGKKLSKTHEQTRIRLEKANALLTANKSRKTTTMMLVKIFGIERSQAYNIINSSIELFGDVMKSTPAGMRHIMTERLMQVVERASLAQDLKEMNNALKLIAKINGLMVDDVTELNIENLILPTQINYSTDPRALKQGAEEVEHEEF